MAVSAVSRTPGESWCYVHTAGTAVAQRKCAVPVVPRPFRPCEPRTAGTTATAAHPCFLRRERPRCRSRGDARFGHLPLLVRPPAAPPLVGAGDRSGGG